uniref:Uncharacterized protein n=1 Tax=Spumella elongata TaxID=89044 RepID=A0A7S3GSA3_9STRA
MVGSLSVALGGGLAESRQQVFGSEPSVIQVARGASNAPAASPAAAPAGAPAPSAMGGPTPVPREVWMGYHRLFAHDYFERWGHWSTGGPAAIVWPTASPRSGGPAPAPAPVAIA